MGLWVGIECVLCVGGRMEWFHDWRANRGGANAVQSPYHFWLFFDPPAFSSPLAETVGTTHWDGRSTVSLGLFRGEYFPEQLTDSYWTLSEWEIH